MGGSRGTYAPGPLVPNDRTLPVLIASSGEYQKRFSVSSCSMGWGPAAQSAAVPATSSRGIALKLRVTLRDAKETRDRALTTRAVE